LKIITIGVVDKGIEQKKTKAFFLVYIVAAAVGKKACIGMNSEALEVCSFCQYQAMFV